MDHLTSSVIRRRGGVAVATIFVLIWVTLAERGSEQHANRLYRSGRLAEAVEIYENRVAADSSLVRLRYNLGTTLLDLDNPAAEGELARGTEGAGIELRTRAFYNLGLWSLRQAIASDVADSAEAHAIRAVEAGKRALLLAPGQADAVWNLAMAQRMLDSIEAGDGPSGEESKEGPGESDEMMLSDELSEFEDDGNLSDAPRRGADEALAQPDDTTPLTPLEAEDILTAGPRPDVMIRKLLAFEGRSERRLRGRRTSPRW